MTINKTISNRPVDADPAKLADFLNREVVPLLLALRTAANAQNAGQGAALSVLGNPTNADAERQDIEATSGTGLPLRESGGTLGFGQIGVPALSGSGTRDDTTFYRGDGVFAQPAQSNFDVLSAINPKHYWRADNVVESGGLVDTITDLGTGGKDFTAAGAARSPRALDGNGNYYIDPDGTTDRYTAGAAADWAFLNDGSPYTIGMVLQSPANITGAEAILDTCNAANPNRGFYWGMAFTSATRWGLEFLILGGGSVHQNVDYRRPRTDVHTLIMRFSGLAQPTVAAPFCSDWHYRVAGCDVVQVENTSVSAGNPTFALTLFARAVAAVHFSGRWYETWIKDSAVSDRLIQEYERHGAFTYGAAG